MDFALTAAGQQVKAFETQQRIAVALSKGTMVPKEYQGNVANCYIALDVAQRMTLSVLSVMQNLNVIHGKPSWSSTFLIASINATGDYQPLEYEFCGDPGTDDYGCRLVAYAKSDTERVRPIYGEWVTIGIAKAEGWYDRSGSKWRTMPGQMLRYRAAAWWQRAYRPELSLGFLTTEEVREIVDVPAEVISTRRHRLAAIAAQAAQVDNNNDNNTNDDNDGTAEDE